MRARVRNISGEPVVARHGDDVFDFVVTDEIGEVVYAWPRGRSVIDISGTFELAPGEEFQSQDPLFINRMVWDQVERKHLNHRDGNPVPPGVYYVYGYFRGYLADSGRIGVEELEEGPYKLIISP